MNLRDLNRFLDHTLAVHLHPSAVRYIPNSPNLGFFTDSRDDFREIHGIGPGPMILCVANFSIRKNQQLAIRSFLKTGVAGSTLVCIGSEATDYFAMMSSMLRDQGPRHPAQKVLLLTGLSRLDTMKAYVACDLTLLTAKDETMPLVLIESMAFSKPWIATRSGCIAQMEGGIPVRTEQEIVISLRDLMLHADDAVRLGAQGRNAYDAHYESGFIKRQWTQLITEPSSSGFQP